jgi:hypothetical protein
MDANAGLDDRGGRPVGDELALDLEHTVGERELDALGVELRRRLAAAVLGLDSRGANDLHRATAHTVASSQIAVYSISTAPCTSLVSNVQV